MIKKEKWMKRGAKVIANGFNGRLTSLIWDKNSGYVHYIKVRINGRKRSLKYHPDDVTPL